MTSPPGLIVILKPQRAFSLIELLSVIAVIGVLAALTLAGTSRARTTAKRLGCQNNLNQIAKGVLMYANDDAKGALTPFEGYSERSYPHNWLWRYLNKPSPSLWICPATENSIVEGETIDPDTGEEFVVDLIIRARFAADTRGNSYDIFPHFRGRENFWNGNVDAFRNSDVQFKTLDSVGAYQYYYNAFGKAGKNATPATTWIYSDQDSLRKGSSWMPDPENNHGKTGMNVAFVDGHVEFVKRGNVVRSYEFSQDDNRTREYPIGRDNSF